MCLRPSRGIISASGAPLGYNHLVGFLCLDPGEKRVGVAVAEAPLFVAVALETLPAQPRESLIEMLRKHAKERAVTLLVVGLPVQTDGREGASAQAARDLGDAVAQALELPVEYQDERMTSDEAAHALIAGGGSAKARKSRRDTIAAVLILDAYLQRTGRAK